MRISAVTVLDTEAARMTILGGAKYNVSLLIDAVFQLRAIPYNPGCMMIKEIVSILESGSDIVKLFPGSTMGGTVSKVSGQLFLMLLTW